MHSHVIKVKIVKSSPFHPPLKHPFATFLPFNTHLSIYQRFIKTIIVKIKNLYLPHTIKKIGYRAFGGIDNLNYVSCPVKDPALISTDINAFDESNISALELHVPSGSKNKYSNCAPWSGFNSFSETSNTVYGDVNGDGKLNAADLSYMLQRISNLSNPGFYVGSADLTGDRKVDMDDVEKLRKEIIKNYKK